MRHYRSRRASGWEIILAGLLMFILIWAASGPSDASESPKTVSKGYYGDQRVRVVEKASKADSGTTTKKGWVGDKRIDLKVIRKNEYTETRGWVEGERVKVRENNDDS